MGLDMIQDEAPVTWDHLVSRYRPLVYSTLHRVLGRHDDVEDLIQEVFLRVFRSLDTFTPISFAGWVVRIATNIGIDHLRRARRMRVEPVGFDVVTRDNSPSAGDVYEATHVEGSLRRALDALPPDLRQAVTLKDLCDMSCSQVAAVLGVPEATARTRIFRGRQRLRDVLTGAATRR